MAKGKKQNKEKGGESKKAPALRPLRPLLCGLSIGCGWGALNVPTSSSMFVLGGFLARVVAISIISGGALAIAVELLAIMARQSIILVRRGLRAGRA